MQHLYKYISITITNSISITKPTIDLAYVAEIDINPIEEATRVLVPIEALVIMEEIAPIEPYVRSNCLCNG
jgi:hypothetical protein